MCIIISLPIRFILKSGDDLLRYVKCLNHLPIYNVFTTPKEY